jgi:serine/threonine-protein kinase
VGRTTISTARVAVLPFSVRGSEDVAYLGEGMVDLLSTALDGAGELSAVDPYALMKFLTGERDGPLDPEAGEAVASRFGAGRFVLGSIVEAGGRLQVNASLYAADGRIEISAEEIAESEAQVFDLVNNVARQLLAAGMGGPSARLTQVAAATTNSLTALKAYLEGESEMRAARFASAASAYGRAIEADSTFALAWYRLAIAALFSPTPTGVMPSQAAAQAVRFGGRLSQRDRDRLAVVNSFLTGDLLEGERLVRAILRSYPEDMEAWYYLGEFLFHYGARHGRPIAEAGAAFERALEYDPDHFSTLMHLSWIRSVEHRYVDLEGLVKRLVELERGSEFPQFSRPILAFLEGGQPAVRALLRDLRTETGMSLTFGGVYQLALLDEGLATAVEIAGLLTDPSRSASERSSGYAMQANLEVARGRLRAAGEVLDRWETLGLQTHFETPLEKRTAMWVSSVVPVERAELEELRVRLADLDYDTVYSPVTRPYLLGLVNAHLGRPVEGLRYASQLESHAARQGGEGSSRAERLAEYSAVILRAQVAYDEGDSEGAFRLLGQARADDWWTLSPRYLLLSQAHERYLRAQTLEALGRDEEALGWYASLGWGSQADIFYVAPALLRSAEIYERLGEPEQAATYYRRFITRWGDCDPELRPLVTGAEEALARLTEDAEAP